MQPHKLVSTNPNLYAMFLWLGRRNFLPRDTRLIHLEHQAQVQAKFELKAHQCLKLLPHSRGTIYERSTNPLIVLAGRFCSGSHTLLMLLTLSATRRSSAMGPLGLWYFLPLSHPSPTTQAFPADRLRNHSKACHSFIEDEEVAQLYLRSMKVSLVILCSSIAYRFIK